MNDWMRHHQKIVLFFALLAMIGTGFYGVSYLVKGPGGTGRGPSGGYYTLAGRKINVEPEELLQLRLLRWHYNRGRDYPGAEAIRDVARVRVASDLGIAVGDDELTSLVREDIKSRTSKDKVTPDLLRHLLDELQLTQGQYENLTMERSLVGKLIGLYQSQAITTEGESYISYCQRKQRLRLFYKEFPAKAFEELAGDPAPNEITEYYSKYSNPPKKDEPPHGALDSLDTDPALSADILYLSNEFVKKDWNPTEEQLKQHYERTRNFYRVDGQTQALPTGDTAYKPYDEVKDKVLEDYRRAEVQTRANELKSQLEKELSEEERKATEAGKKLDWAAFAEKKGLTYWRTEKLTQHAFDKGSEKIKAPDFRYAGDYALFRLAEPGETPDAEKKKVDDRKKFSGARRILYNSPEEGFVMFRIAEYSAKELMSLEEATPVIRRRLRERRAGEKALEAAKKYHDQWISGEATPKPEDLQDEVCVSGSTNPLFQELNRVPQPVGEVLEVSPYQVDQEARKEHPDTRLGRYLVGFIAERDIPTLAQYELDTVDREGGMMAQYKSMFRGRELAYELYDYLPRSVNAEIDIGVPDLPLNTRSEPLPPPPDM